MLGNIGDLFVKCIKINHKRTFVPSAKCNTGVEPVTGANLGTSTSGHAVFLFF